jgi:hypothetical protein
MPRAAAKPAGASANASGGETIAGYFRKVFKANPELPKGRSNDELYRHWLADHPGQKEVPNNVRAGLQNIKAALRSKKRGRKKVAAQETNTAPVAQAAPRKPMRNLNALEEQIDDCLQVAKATDREGLAEVIDLLRRARNKVVWEMGE